MTVVHLFCLQKKGRENPPECGCCSAKKIVHRGMPVTTDIDICYWMVFSSLETCVCYFLNNINKNIEKVLQNKNTNKLSIFFSEIFSTMVSEFGFMAIRPVEFSHDCLKEPIGKIMKLKAHLCLIIIIHSIFDSLARTVK